MFWVQTLKISSPMINNTFVSLQKYEQVTLLIMGANYTKSAVIFQAVFGVLYKERASFLLALKCMYLN